MPAIVLPKSKLEISQFAKAELLGASKRTIYSFSEWCPNNHKTCRMNNQAMQAMGKPLGYSLCPVNGYTKYKISCKNCREELATVYGKDASLEDWRRLRYTSWYDKNFWHGLRGLNIDPKTSQLRIECCCEPEDRKTIDKYKVEEIN